MAHKGAQRIRNVAIVGHRGSGKTSLNEALLFEAGAINRLGSVADGSTVSDSEPDEVEREMSISASLSSFEYEDRKINLIDTPGEPSFVADTLAALSVCESAVFVVNGVMGVEVTTDRLWQRADELGLARLVFVNMLDRERADFFRTLDSLKAAFGPHVVATEIPIGSEHETRGIVDLIDMKAYEYDGAGRGSATEIPIPDEVADAGRGVPREADGRGGRELRRADGALPRGRGDLPRRDRRARSRRASRRARSSRSPAASRPRTSAPTGCSTRWSTTCRRRPRRAPSPRATPRATRSQIEPDDSGDPIAYVFKTLADPFAGRINLFRVYSGVREGRLAGDQRARPRQGAHRPAAHRRSGKEMAHADEFGAGRHRRGREAEGDALRRRAVRQGRRASRSRRLQLPAAVMAFAIEPKSKGDEEKVSTALRRLQEEDPTLDFHRDPQTGEQIIAGLSQVHVEVIVDRMKRRFGAEVNLKPPRVPYQETIKGKRQGAGPLQEADRRPRPVRRLPHRDRAAAARRAASSSSTRSRAA